MRRPLIITLLALSVTISGCGIIIGQLMTAGAGVKELKAVKGEMEAIKTGSTVVLVAPFAKRGSGFHVSRGDDASRLAEAWTSAGLFKADMRFDDSFDDPKAIAALKEKSAAELAKGLGLQVSPDYLVFGTITERDTVVAPTKGVMMTVAWELEFFEVGTKTSTTLYVKAEEVYRELANSVAREMSGALGM